jgi:glycosyltransferase involved in cell wall biosynthesis
MTILTTTYNCENYVERCLYSLMSQRFKDFTCYITDDLSTDGTVNKIKEIIKDDKRFILIENHIKLYQPGNYDQIIRWRGLEGDEICVEVDGDDWLPNPNVLSIIKNTYDDPKVWMTSGSFKYQDGRKGFNRPITSLENIRKSNFTLSHLRTWKSWLWKKIEERDLKDIDGKYYSVAGDLAFMWPMIEMSGLEHFRFIDEILYVYNESNPINDHKVDINKVRNIHNLISNKTPYKRIDK